MKNTFKKLLAFTFAFLMVISSATGLASAASVGKVISLQAYDIDDDEVNLRWKKVTGADGYRVYMYTSKGWKSQGTTKKTNFEVDDLAGAKQYKFKVRAYDIKNGKRTYGKFSNVLLAATAPDEVENLKAVKRTQTSLKLSWSKEKRATRYQVYLYDASLNKYVRQKTVASNSVTIKDLEPGTTYRFKVRAYFKAGEKKYYGEFSDVLKVKTKGKAAQNNSQETEFITRAEAGAIALEHAGIKKTQVREYECELDRENGIIVYEVEFEYKAYEYEYEINAVTGKILSVEKSRD